MIKNIIEKNRSYRRFFQDQQISIDLLKELVNLARLSASARNLQSLKYMLSNKKETNEKIFEQLSWAGYLKDWQGPSEGEKPAAYIIIVADKNISNNLTNDWVYTDFGIACQSILLGAVETGFGGCILAAIKRKKLRELLYIDERFEILGVIALGKPKEEIVIDELKLNENNIKYWRDDNNVHHVPKRNINEIIIEIN